MPPSRVSNNDIFIAIGELKGQLAGLQENVALLRKDVGDEKTNAHESRVVIHRRLDEQADRISSVQTKIEIHGQIEAQLRDNIKGLRETVETDISPTIDEWKRIKFLGGVASSALIALGITAATAVAWIYDWLAIALRYLSKGH